MTSVETGIMAGYLVALSVFGIALLLGLWPEGHQLTKDESKVYILWRVMQIKRERHLLVIVTVMGVLGGATHSLWWLALEELKTGQVVWYVAQPLLGCVVSLFFYGLVRGGLITGSDGSKDLNVYGVAGLAGLVGYSAYEVLDKILGIVR